MAYNHIEKFVSVLNEAYKSSLTSDATQAIQPTEIRVPLRAHQKAILHSMAEREKELSVGMDLCGAKIYSRFSFLGDGVGVGKSLMVLGHIAQLKTQQTLPLIPQLDINSTSQLYSLRQSNYASDLSDASCLIVVPHTLYRQWQTYIKDQTSLTCLGVQTKAVLGTNTIIQKMKEVDVVLVSNTLYGPLQDLATQNHLIWKRVFFDESDTIHIPSTRTRATTRFTWLISASWANLLYPNTTQYINNAYLATIPANPHLDETLKKELLQLRNQSSSNVPYVYMRYLVVSSTFFRDFVGTSNPFRGNLVLRCREEFVRESITLPPISIRNILCRTSILHQVVAHAIPADVRSLLHAGDIKGALDSLGVRPEEPVSLIKAVTENRIKELTRLRLTFTFKSSLEYSSPQAKEQALKSLTERINSLEEQIKGLKERIENYKTEICPICFDEPQTPTLTPCCHRIFCGSCILTSMTRASTCPLCRSPIHASGLRNVATEPVERVVDISKPDDQPLKKTEQLLNLMKLNPTGKFLIFSRFDNPFIQLSQEIEAMKLTVKLVKGNKDVIAQTLKSFQKGDTNVLLLNSIQAGAGLNITAATHVILLHAMTHEEEKQILGRAYRLGRTEPLEVVRLLHPDEMVHAQQ
jgi:hypothetical protein